MPIERPIADFNTGLLNAIMIGQRIKDQSLQQESQKLHEERQARLDEIDAQERAANADFKASETSRRDREERRGEMQTLAEMMSRPGSKAVKGGQVSEEMTLPNIPGAIGLEGLRGNVQRPAAAGRTMTMPLSGESVELADPETAQALLAKQHLDKIRGEEDIRTSAAIAREQTMLDQFGIMVDPDGPGPQQPAKVMPNQAPGLMNAQPKPVDPWKLPAPMSDDITKTLGLPPGTQIPRENLLDAAKAAAGIRQQRLETTLKGVKEPPPPKSLPEPAIKRLEKEAGAAEQLTRLTESFKPEYAGNMVTGGLENTLGRMGGEKIGLADKGQTQWWQDYQGYINQVRNELFGASLTPGEKSEFEKQIVTSRMDPAEAKKNLTRQKEIVDKALQRTATVYEKGGYNPEQIGQYVAKPTTPSGSLPSVGGTFNGEKVLKVEKVK